VEILLVAQKPERRIGGPLGSYADLTVN